MAESMRERLDRIREQQRAAGPISLANVAEAVSTLLTDHADHTLQHVGRCVWCCDCDRRLYQGRIPASHVKVRAMVRREPVSTTEMRQRWGKL